MSGNIKYNAIDDKVIQRLTVEQVKEVMAQFLSPNPTNESLQQATMIIKKYLSYPHSVAVVFDIMRNSSVSLRQLGSLLLKRKLSKHFRKLEKEQQEFIKKSCRELIVNETSRPVRKSLAILISIIGRMTIPLGEFPELMPFLNQLCSSNSQDHREIGLYIFEAMIEHIGEVVKNYFPEIHKIVKRSLDVKENYKVRIQALKLVGVMSSWLDTAEDVKLFRDLVPKMMDVIHFCIKNNFEDEAIQGLGTFDDLIETAVPVLETYIPLLVKFVLDIMKQKSLSLNLRVSAGEFVCWVARLKGKLLTLNNLIEPILDVAFAMAASSEDNDHIVADSWEITLNKYGCQVIQTIGKHLPTRLVFPVAMKHIERYASSQNPYDRRAALGALMVLAGSCVEPMVTNIDKLMPYLFKGFVDPNVLVRQTSVVCLGQFALHFQPEITQYHSRIMPVIFEFLGKHNDTEMQERATYALVEFVTNLEEGIIPFLEQVMQNLIKMLTVGKKDIQEMALSAITATANASKEKFAPYFDVTIKMMKELMRIKDKKNMILRCRAIECAGILAVACGKKAFQPHLEYFMKAAVSGLALGDTEELREYTFTFFANISEVLEADFAPFLPTVLPLVIAGCDNTDGVYRHMSEEDKQLQDLVGNWEDDGSEEDEEDELDNYRISVSSGFVEEKLQALHALSTIAISIGKDFIPYIERCMQSLDILARYIHPGIRTAALVPLENFVMSVHIAYPPKESWKAGIPGDQPPNNSISPQTRKFATRVLDTMFYVLETDDDRGVVSKSLEIIGGLSALIGPGIIQPYMNNKVKPLFMDIIKGTSQCQSGDGYDDPNYDDEGEDELEELQVFIACCEAICLISKVFGPLFINWMDFLEELVRHHMKPTSPNEYKRETVGTVAEVLKHIGRVPGIQRFLGGFVEIALRGLNDSHGPVRSNSAYLAGLLCTCCDQSVQYYPELLKRIHPLFSHETRRIVDNACGALGRMIMANHKAVPLSQILPIFMKSLPLKEDFEESEPTYGAICALVKSQNESIAPFIPKVICMFCDSVFDDRIEPESVRANIKDTLKLLATKFGSQLEPLLKNMNQKQKENFQRALKQ